MEGQSKPNDAQGERRGAAHIGDGLLWRSKEWMVYLGGHFKYRIITITT